MYKVQWSHHTEEEATWEREEKLNVEFLIFFSDPSNLEGEIHFKRVAFVTPCFLERINPRRFFIFN
jgi:hypothetical protein